jgi:colicin import membrane protein
MNLLSERQQSSTPIWPSFLFSSGIHMAVLLMILLSPSWGHKRYHPAPQALWVNLVELPGLPKGTPSAALTSALPGPAAPERKVLAPPPAKESPIQEVKRSEKIQTVRRSEPDSKPKDRQKMQAKAPVPPQIPTRIQPAAPTTPAFSLPPLPSVTPRGEATRASTGGLPGGSGDSTARGSSGVGASPLDSKASRSGEKGAGQAGGSGGVLGVASSMPGVRVDNPDFQFTYYLVIIQNKISSNWNPPYAAGKAGERPKAMVAFQILRNGQIRDVRVESSSGVSFLDQSALRAISRSIPLPPLPQRFLDDSLGVHFSFELEGGKS